MLRHTRVRSVLRMSAKRSRCAAQAIAVTTKLSRNPTKKGPSSRNASMIHGAPCLRSCPVARFRNTLGFGGLRTSVGIQQYPTSALKRPILLAVDQQLGGGRLSCARRRSTRAPSRVSAGCPAWTAR
jgi:hypothetical protein